MIYFQIIRKSIEIQWQYLPFLNGPDFKFVKTGQMNLSLFDLRIYKNIIQ